MTIENKDESPISVVSYASYTYNSPSFLVRFPHRKRNKLIADAIASEKPYSWLDYGAGDGALLRNLATLHAIPKKVLLFDPDPYMRDQLTTQACSIGLGTESITGDYDDTIKTKYNLITALEVLEHLPLPERIRFYHLLATTLIPGGKCLIEVPIEYGPILLLKEFGRKFLKKRISGYTFRELLNAAIFSEILDAHSRYLINDSRSFISPHRGFDLNRLIIELSSIGIVQEMVRSPFPFLPRVFNQVAVFSFEIKERDASKIEAAVLQASQAGT